MRLSDTITLAKSHWGIEPFLFPRKTGINDMLLYFELSPTFEQFINLVMLYFSFYMQICYTGVYNRRVSRRYDAYNYQKGECSPNIQLNFSINLFI